MGKNIMKFDKIIFSVILIFCCSWNCLKAQSQSLYNDIRAHKVGDVITVILTENISRSSSTNASTHSNTAGSAQSGMNSNFLPFEPVFGADAEISYNSDERILAGQKQMLSVTMSVRIKEDTLNDSCLTAGQRNTEINGERNIMSLEGFIRPADISNSNRLLSYRIADARIKYLKKENLGTIKNKP